MEPAKLSTPARQAIFEALEAAGKLEPIRAQLRAAAFHSLRGGPDAESAEASLERRRAAAAEEPAETLLVRELIREYLTFAGLDSTLSVFLAETGMAPVSVPRPVLASECGVGGIAAPDVPIIYSMLADCRMAAQDAPAH
jgi:lisH domain-containing protein FOPNL